MKVHDITIPVRPGMVTWPGDPVPERRLHYSMADGAGCNLSLLTLGVHTGTHVDAPFHTVADGATVDQMSPADLVGPAQVVEPPGDDHVDAAALEACGIRPGATRVLLRTRNSVQGLLRRAAFDEGFRAIAPDGAAWLVEHGVRVVGVDYLSVQPMGPLGAGTHDTLLRAGVIAIEGCDLADVAPGDYTLVCAPVLLEGADGAPARVFLVSGGAL